MRVALPLTLSILTSAAPALAQTTSARCAPRVEATAAVPPATVARLTAAVSSGAQAAPGQCPLVRFDVVGGRLVMTAVLDDGRQVARVLRSQGDALPTLVALMATPLAHVPDEAPDVAPPAEPVAPMIVEAPNPPALVEPALTVPAPAPPPVTPWGLRLGLSAGLGRFAGDRLLLGSLDVEALRPRWAFGLRGGYERAGSDEMGSSAVTAAVSARHRWVLGRWEIDLGPALGARWAFGGASGEGFALRAGAEGSLSFSLGAAWSVFARLDGGVDLMGGSDDDDDDDESHDRRQRRHESDPPLSWGAALGLRWAVTR